MKPETTYAEYQYTLEEVLQQIKLIEQVDVGARLTSNIIKDPKKEKAYFKKYPYQTGLVFLDPQATVEELKRKRLDKVFSDFIVVEMRIGNNDKKDEESCWGYGRIY